MGYPRGSQMTQNTSGAMRRIWKSAQLFIGFHRDQDGNQREQAYTWPPKNALASLHSDPTEQESFVIIRAAEPDAAHDIQIKLHPDQLILRRDPDAPGWEGVIIRETEIAVRVNGTWIKIKGDGSIAQDKDGGTTYVVACPQRVVRFDC